MDESHPQTQPEHTPPPSVTKQRSFAELQAIVTRCEDAFQLAGVNVARALDNERAALRDLQDAKRQLQRRRLDGA